ncbi:hypothetical protein LS68_008040 [Helicobacter sp. MIT 05-5293]|uniref:hypothetical protein n=1 Tax=Helicobacter sp. MIT 05-5293 TaxID=1548149 RepID=UPI00068A6DFD|nr:hypothetical protein [Helicobacter sp. MIT 05-5293]TLD80158.1 hypothetical protein LS68_008040 [Helicobacter sp. MIT 05-5293]
MKKVTLLLIGLLFWGCDSQYTQETTLKTLKSHAFQAFYGMPRYDSNNDFDKKINEIVEVIMKEHNIPQDLKQNFTNCIHYTLWNKSDEVTLDIPIKSCVGDYNNNILQNTTYFNPSFVMGNFSSWDGSNAIVERFIKSNMNDEQSYKHIKTTYAIRGIENPQNISIITNFSGKNAFGGVVKQTAHLKLGSKGEILEAEGY